MRILLFLVAHSGARTWRHAGMVDVVTAAILTNRGSRKQNTFLIMIMRSRRRVEPSQKAVPGAGWGRVLLMHRNALYRLTVDIYVS